MSSIGAVLVVVGLILILTTYTKSTGKVIEAILR